MCTENKNNKNKKNVPLLLSTPVTFFLILRLSVCSYLLFCEKLRVIARVEFYGF